jgi:DNA-binding PadR family transcriptional regulator
MGWRPSSDMDAVVWTLLDGPLPIAAMVDKLEPIWEAVAKGQWDRVPALNYQAVYQRLRRLEDAEVVVVDGKAKGGRCGANAYRLLTKQERETQRTVMRQRMEPSDEVRGMFYRIEKEMKVNIIYECEYLGKRRWQRALIVRTNRGEARFGLSTRDSWNDALVEAGLI